MAQKTGYDFDETPVDYNEFAARNPVSDWPVARADIHRRPWDTRAIVETRKALSLSIAENLLDVDVGKRASLYSKLPDSILMDVQKVSQNLTEGMRDARNMVLGAIAGAGINTAVGLSVDFSTATHVSYGCAALLAGVGIAKGYLVDRRRDELVKAVDEQIEKRGIRPSDPSYF